MRWKILAVLFVLLVTGLLIFYWFIPMKNIQFGAKSGSSNFSLGIDEDMQFYPNMRFSDSEISYKIEDCPLAKENEMQRAFEIMENLTVLDFYPSANEDISITCDSGTKIEGGLFIAGEGGPTQIISGEKFNVITHGKILLIRDSKCETPNVAIHELLHVLGFEHSTNSNNIMYPVTKCGQTIGDDTIGLLDTIYSIPSYADLKFENVSAAMRGKYLDVDVTVSNVGLDSSQEAMVKIYVDDKLVKEFVLGAIDIGEGKIVFMENIWVPQISTNELRLEIESTFSELEKENNKIILKIK